MNYYTIIVPTHNRHNYLRRSIKYFSGFKANIIYVDSSSDAYRGEFSSNMKYFHLSSNTFSQKSLFAIKQCTTDYIAFCADDDFLLEGALNSGIEKLEFNKDLVASVGQYFGFDKQFDGNFFKLYNREHYPDVEQDGKQNIENFLSNYHQILWSLFRRNTIEVAYELINEAEFTNDNFIEIVIATLCAGTGGITFVDECWCVRENNSEEHWGQRHVPLHLISGANEINEDISRFIELLNPLVGAGNAELAIKSYIESSKTADRYVIIRNILPKKLITYLRKLKIITSRRKIIPINLQPVIDVLNEIKQ